ncbi:MAG TPA: type II toxin-antitoxin system VapC family toxin [Solirubrobacterales bacterium]|nr:type II toxin-antitoxin system VapC family toxin [Solirubrobacterales bacterium]
MSPNRGLIDTSVVVDLEQVDPDLLPDDLAISTLTLAELACGPHAASDDLERARRQNHLQQVEASLEPLSFDPRCGRAFGQIYAAVSRVGRKARGARTVDLMIAATALAHELPLYTLNAADLRGLEDLVEIVALG